jgi:hypothetical protein
MTPPLADLQRQFAAGLVGDDPASALAVLRPLCGLAPRLGAYRHAYRARLTEALRSNHPVLHRAMGDAAFDDLALGYIAAQPSTQPSIRWFGHRLAEHMAGLPEPQAPHPALADLARMEWALSLAFDAADAPALERASLAAVPPEAWATHGLRCHPAVQCLALQWQVAPLWQTLTRDADAQAEAPTPAEHALLVWRQGGGPRWRSLAETEAALLRAALAGQSLAGLCSVAAGHGGAEQAPATVAATLHRWLDHGLLCGMCTMAVDERQSPPVHHARQRFQRVS